MDSDMEVMKNQLKPYLPVLVAGVLLLGVVGFGGAIANLSANITEIFGLVGDILDEVIDIAPKIILIAILFMVLYFMRNIIRKVLKMIKI